MAIAPLVVALPLLVGAFLAAVGSRLRLEIPTYISIVTAVLVAVGCSWLAWPSHAGTSWMGGWGMRGGIAVGIALVADPVGAGLGALSALLMIAAFVFTLGHFHDSNALFDALMLLFLGALVAFGLTGDLFDLFVFFELMSAAAYALCAYKSDEAGPLQGAFNFAVTNTVGAVLVVIGLALVYGRTGQLNFAAVQQSLGRQHDALVVTSFWLIACGFLVKAAVFPFHFWLGDAHAVAPTPVSVMFSGVMVTAGIYATGRVYFSVYAPALLVDMARVRGILLAVGTATVLVGSMMCWGQRHLKRLLAFSTVAHVGVMTLGVATLSPRGVGGAIVYALGHGFDKGALFLLAGTLLHSKGTIDEIQLRGRGDLRTGIAWGVAALGLAGLPPFGTFSGEQTISHAASAAHAGWVEVVTAIASIMTTAAVLRAGARVFLGWGPAAPEIPGSRDMKEQPDTSGTRDVPWSMTASALALLFLALSVGLIPHARRAALAAAARFCDSSGYAVAVTTGAPRRLPIAVPQVLADSFVRPAIVIILAIGLAALALLRAHLPNEQRRYERKIVRAVYRIPERIHSGHVGDYVTWLVLGVAAIAGAAVVGVR